MTVCEFKQRKGSFHNSRSIEVSNGEYNVIFINSLQKFYPPSTINTELQVVQIVDLCNKIV